MHLQSLKLIHWTSVQKNLAVTRARGRKSGWPSLPEYKKWVIKFLYDEQKLTYEEIGNQTGESRATIYRVVKEIKKLILWITV